MTTLQHSAGPATLPALDFDAFFSAVDERRRQERLGWFEFADVLWQQSEVLNVSLGDHPLCGGAVSRLGGRGETSCQYAAFLLRWLGRAPEEFLVGTVRQVGDTTLPEVGPGQRLRWDLAALYAELNGVRSQQGLTWAALGTILDCTPARLTNLRTARQADFALVMRVTQWLAAPAARFLVAADW
ncbi:hypothetical protein GIS00_14230 [Nakamurella sp. YIM 132087]|uniref:Uncharacterized protein n=1 Tax=Nakamurella alba TaxID=2665158 RepID=A0A7K1FLR7_9ACTN|nr:hypothetical protein [Nakamurella alba]MTD15097.1 hypothetical protein [Nakamurella alba]